MKKPKWDCAKCKQSSEWKARGCRKHFPDQFNPNRPDWWQARVEVVSQAGGKRSVEIPEVTLNECPVSYISAESLQIVEIVGRNRIAKEAGAPLFGMNANRWPAWFHDALMIAAAADNAEHQARSKTK